MREAVQKERFIELYGIDPSDLSIYDVIFDTNLQSIERTSIFLRRSSQNIWRKRKRSEH